MNPILPASQPQRTPLPWGIGHPQGPVQPPAPFPAPTAPPAGLTVYADPFRPVHPVCVLCGMYRTSKAVCIPGEGNPDAEIAAIGEGLGETEEESGLNFQGRAGWVLNRSLFDAGLLRSAIWICNAVRCRPKNPAGQNRPPTVEELGHCRTFLDEELARLPRLKVLVALGASAGWSLLAPEVPPGGVLENQGRTFWSERYQRWVVQTIHPAWALRKPGESLWLTLDLKKAAHIAEVGRPPTPQEPRYKVVRMLTDAYEMRAALRLAPYLVWDWETDGVHPTRSHGFCVSFCGAADFAWVVPRYGASWTPLWAPADLATLDGLLRDVFTSPVPKIGHHAAFDYIITLTTLHVRPTPIVGDTMLLHHLLNNHLSERAHGLKRMADMYTAYGRYDDALDEWLVAHGYTRDGKPNGAYIYMAPNEVVWKYNAVDSIVPWLLHPRLEQQARAAGLWEVYTDERMPLALEYAEMDRYGVPTSAPRLEALSGDLGAAMEAVKGAIGAQVQVHACPTHGKLRFEACGCAPAEPRKPGATAEPLNPNSPQQVQAYLHQHRGFPVIARTETGQPSTREDVLLTYAEVESLIPPILHYRAYSKLKGTYVENKDGTGGLRVAVDEDGFARPSTLLTAVETFRLATRKPFPLHLIPRPIVLWSCFLHGRYQFGAGPEGDRTPCCSYAKQELLNIRGVVQAPAQHVFLAGDYVQQEYALAAIASGQTDLEEAMLDRREDAHEYTMQILSGRSRHEFQVQDPATGNWTWASPTAEDAYKNMRSDAKATNFMILYRGGAEHLARDLRIDVDDAERKIADYYDRFAQIKWWQYRIIKALQETGMVVGLFKTYRKLPNIWSPFRSDRNEAERQACNQPFQDGGAHVLARGILRLAQRWRRERFPGRVLFSVHDEIIAMVREDLVAEGAASMREEMERPHPELVGGCGIPRGILADIRVVREWGGHAIPELQTLIR